MNKLIGQLAALRDSILEVERRHVLAAGGPHPNYAESQRNLLHYLALRAHDLRPLQHELAALGLSSLGRVESHVLASIDAVSAALHSVAGESPRPGDLGSEYSTFETGNRFARSS